MRVTVSDTTELGADPETGSTHTLFVIHISEDDGREYDVRRRFSHFVELREELIRTGCAIVEDLEFPSRKLWGSSSQETVRERQLSFETLRCLKHLARNLWLDHRA